MSILPNPFNTRQKFSTADGEKTFYSLPALEAGELLWVGAAGAYGATMASNYNTRCLAAEVMVKGNRAALVRERQTAKEIWSGEKAAPWLR